MKREREREEEFFFNEKTKIFRLVADTVFGCRSFILAAS